MAKRRVCLFFDIKESYLHFNTIVTGTYKLPLFIPLTQMALMHFLFYIFKKRIGVAGSKVMKFRLAGAYFCKNVGIFPFC